MTRVQRWTQKASGRASPGAAPSSTQLARKLLRCRSQLGCLDPAGQGIAEISARLGWPGNCRDVVPSWDVSTQLARKLLRYHTGPQIHSRTLSPGAPGGGFLSPCAAQSAYLRPMCCWRAEVQRHISKARVARAGEPGSDVTPRYAGPGTAGCLMSRGGPNALRGGPMGESRVSPMDMNGRDSTNCAQDEREWPRMGINE